MVKKNKAEKGDREFQLLRRERGRDCSFKARTKKVTSEQIPEGGKEVDQLCSYLEEGLQGKKNARTLWTRLGQACSRSSSHVATLRQ